MDWTPTLELFKEQRPARVERKITSHHRGRVFFAGTSWPAKIYDGTNLEFNDDLFDVSNRVTVIGRQGLTLLVVPSGASV